MKLKVKIKIKIKKIYRKITMYIFCLLFLKTHIIIPLIFNLNLFNFLLHFVNFINFSIFKQIIKILLKLK
jgi:hypothetical protein